MKTEDTLTAPVDAVVRHGIRVRIEFLQYGFWLFRDYQLPCLPPVGADIVFEDDCDALIDSGEVERVYFYQEKTGDFLPYVTIKVVGSSFNIEDLPYGWQKTPA